MKYTTITEVPSDLKDFYTTSTSEVPSGTFTTIVSEGEDLEVIPDMGEVVKIPLGESKELTDLERVITLGKPQRVLDLFAEAVATGFKIKYLEEYEEYLKDLESWQLAKDLEEPEEFSLGAPTKPTRYTPTALEIFSPYAREIFKAERASKVKAITVEVEGLTFDGDEDSQARMSRAVLILEPEELMPWTLADNTIVAVDKGLLIKVLRAAGLIQSGLWAL